MDRRLQQSFSDPEKMNQNSFIKSFQARSSSQKECKAADIFFTADPSAILSDMVLTAPDEDPKFLSTTEAKFVSPAIEDFVSGSMFHHRAGSDNS